LNSIFKILHLEVNISEVRKEVDHCNMQDKPHVNTPIEKREISAINKPDSTLHDMWNIGTGDFHLLETEDIFHHCKIFLPE
jgi:hypothetical protein